MRMLVRSCGSGGSWFGGQQLLLLPAVLALAPISGAGAAAGAEAAFVTDGRLVHARTLSGEQPRTDDGYVLLEGQGFLLMADRLIDSRDFLVRVKLTLSELNGGAPSLMLNGRDHFGFDSRSHKIFVEGPRFRGTHSIGDTRDHIRPGEPFTVELERRGGTLSFRIDGETLYEAADGASTLGHVALRPWRSTMHLHEFTATAGSFTPLDLPEQTDVYVSGTDGYDTYRIPSIITTPRGSLLAFAEGRKHGRGDSGDIDMLVKRSDDGGQTWSEQHVVWDDGPNTCGNPCPVVDEQTGVIHLLMTHNPGDYHEFDPTKVDRGTRTVWITSSRDDGRTWAEPREITAEVKDPSWQWYATGPGVGIQVQQGPHRGRLVIPANHSHPATGEHAIRQNNTYGIGAHVIYSDDGGQSWHRSEPIRPRTNESQVFERSDQKLMMNMRAYFGDHRRYTALSDDGGRTWTEPRKDAALIEPVCQASILRYDWPRAGAPDRVLFSNPASTRRERMTVRLSRDDGDTWPASRLIYPGSSAYSCLARLPDGDVGCLYERDGYSAITLARFSLRWLTEGKGGSGVRADEP